MHRNSPVQNPLASHAGGLGVVRVRMEIVMIDDEDIKALDEEFRHIPLDVWLEDDQINRVGFALDTREAGDNLSVMPMFGTVSGWQVELSDLHGRGRLAIAASDLEHAIRLLRHAKWQIRWHRFARFVFRPRASLAGWLKERRTDWSFFTTSVLFCRRNGCSWLESIRLSLLQLLK
jgi:hypothetical protein